MSFIGILNPIMILAVMVIIGYIISKNVEVTSQVRHFISFTVINVALPSVVIQSIFQSEITSSLLFNFSIIFICAIVLNATGMAVGYYTGKICKYTEVESRQMAIMAGCGNTGFMGIPLAHMLLGPTAAAYAAIYDAGTMFTVFTIGIMLLQRGRFSISTFKSMLNMPLITLVVSLSIATFGYGIFPFIFELSAMLSSLAAPLAMIYIGLLIPTISKERWDKVKKGYKSFIASSTLIKTFLMPLTALTGLLFLPIDNTLGMVIVIQAAMPTFLLASVLFGRYNGSEDLGVVGVIVSVIFSLLALPIIIAVTLFYL
ncbi:AEC family transporter [Bacillus sp. FJAT-44742]|uniref:AEC family transporter n=1 Tax=Bacillus sp. FJAT-44742 TaxID=2014005 RepID=UPI000C2361B9|nr:AEC family transporter [Bacillus sp. FJAT-44742]